MVSIYQKNNTTDTKKRAVINSSDSRPNPCHL